MELSLLVSKLNKRALFNLTERGLEKSRPDKEAEIWKEKFEKLDSALEKSSADYSSDLPRGNERSFVGA